VTRIVPDGLESVRDALVDLIDQAGCDLVLTTGGTGPAPRDLTPEGTEAACERMMPGFGELLRRKSLEQVPTAILSRQTAGIRGKALIVNCPGKPSSIRVSLMAVFPAIPYCLDLIGAARIETDPAIVQASGRREAKPAPAAPESRVHSQVQPQAGFGVPDAGR
jgi:molybdopterin adenylyltransferase